MTEEILPLAADVTAKAAFRVFRGIRVESEDETLGLFHLGFVSLRGLLGLGMSAPRPVTAFASHTDIRIRRRDVRVRASLELPRHGRVAAFAAGRAGVITRLAFGGSLPRDGRRPG